MSIEKFKVTTCRIGGGSSNKPVNEGLIGSGTSNGQVVGP